MDELARSFRFSEVVSHSSLPDVVSVFGNHTEGNHGTLLKTLIGYYLIFTYASQ